MESSALGAEIAVAFNQQNDKRSWKANAASKGRDIVYFNSTGGMVSLLYHVQDKRFAVKFNKFQGAWGDYIKAIARSLFVVLNTLKSAGLPFEAPLTLAGMEIIATTTDDTTTYVRWAGDGPPASAAGLLALGPDVDPMTAGTAQLVASNMEPPLPPVL